MNTIGLTERALTELSESDQLRIRQELYGVMPYNYVTFRISHERGIPEYDRCCVMNESEYSSYLRSGGTWEYQQARVWYRTLGF